MAKEHKAESNFKKLQQDMREDALKANELEI